MPPIAGHGQGIKGKEIFHWRSQGIAPYFSVMATAATLTYQDVQKVLAQWKASPNDGPTQEQQDKFIDDTIQELENPEKVQGFVNNVGQVGVWANDVDASFNNVTRGLADMVEKYGRDFPELSGFLSDWGGYQRRWVNHLQLSRDVASQHSTILRRFDQIFLDMVESIQTDQDRQDVILELQAFVDEDHSDSDRMAKGFMDLKKDVADFVVRFGAWIEKTGTELQAQATELKVKIEKLQGDIESLNWEIAAATIALIGSAAGAATIVGLLGVFAAEAALAVLIARRVKAELDLREAQRDLAEVNRKQEALARIKTEFDGLRPDIGLICEKLVLFGQVWQSIRGDTIRFQDHLKQGMDAVTNARFKREIRLARKVCGPMQAGLEKYAVELENRRGRE